jgi:hypothetical protein
MVGSHNASRMQLICIGTLGDGWVTRHYVAAVNCRMAGS